MSIPFIDRNPTDQETNLYRLTMSSYRDGSGQYKVKNEETMPGWRDFERIVSELMSGRGPENKEIFDVVLPSDSDPNTDIGISVKSKELSRKTALLDLKTNGRVHMELANSPAKFWYALGLKSIYEEDFRNQVKAAEIGETVVELVESWHREAVTKHSESTKGRVLDLNKSIYLTISYSPERNGLPRMYQLHSFDLKLPKKLEWKYISDKCIRGYDPEFPEETLIEWYGRSGGQLKYYPRAKNARFFSEAFELAETPRITLRDKVALYWPQETK